MYFVISDIHGDYESLLQAFEFYDKSKFDGIIICGDLLFDGSFFSRTKSSQSCLDLLNEYAEDILACRGNNDISKDLEELKFEVDDEFGLYEIYGRKMLLTHGHLYYETRLPEVGDNDIYMSGHTHMPRADFAYGMYMLNPGSVSSPRGGYPKTYGVLNERGFEVFDFKGNIIKEVTFHGN